MGRPTNYKKEYNQMLIDHMSQGLSYETFAAKIGTHRGVLYEWEKQHPEFHDTKKKAQEISQLWWESAGINGLYTIMEHGDDGKRSVVEKKINQAMWIFNMKARFRWQDQEPKQPDQLTEKKILTLEEKKQLLIQVKKETIKLEEEINGSILSELPTTLT